MLVIDEEDAVAYEHPLAEFHALADEGVALDLAVSPDGDTALKLHERPDPSAGPDSTAIEVHKGMDDVSGSELDVLDQPERCVVRGAVRHFGRIQPRRRPQPPLPAASSRGRSGGRGADVRVLLRPGSHRFRSRGPDMPRRDGPALGSAGRTGSRVVRD